MNNHNGTLHRGWQSLQRWRIQIFVITWLAYAAFYFTRKAFSVAKLGIAEDPSFEPTRAPWPISMPSTWPPTPWASSWVFADRFGTRVVVLGGLLTSALAALVMGTFATLPIFAACMVVQGLAQSTGWSGVQEHRRLLRHLRARPRARPVEYLLRLRRAGGDAVRRLVRLPVDA